MKELVEAVWKNIKQTTTYYKKSNKNIVLNESKKDEFKNEFENMYKEIRSKYMKENVKFLDRHKTAALIIVCMTKCELTYLENKDENLVYLGNEMFSTEIAFNWMLNSLNKTLRKNGIKELKDYILPEPFTCKTRYFEVFCRNLYFAKMDFVLNPLEIAEKLFLIEYITLLKSGIDTSILKQDLTDSE